MGDWNRDRRVEPRKKVMAFTPVYNLTGNALLGYLGDLTMQGAQVIGEKPLEAGARVILTFTLPDDLPEIKIKHMDIPAKVMRCEADEEGKGSYKVGVLFLELSAENEAVIRAMLERYHFRYKR
ncbi:MAG: PilZ domain-containing protein [Chloroflexota bacterium]